jgi:prevent-host-death family protein
MRTMTLLDAQNHFGELIDSSQCEPVLITCRGRPVSFVLSTSSNPSTTLLQVMKLMALCEIQWVTKLQLSA